MVSQPSQSSSIAQRLAHDTEHCTPKGNTSGTGTSVPKVASPDDVSQVRTASVTAFTRLGDTLRPVLVVVLREDVVPHLLVGCPCQGDAPCHHPHGVYVVGQLLGDRDERGRNP